VVSTLLLISMLQSTCTTVALNCDEITFVNHERYVNLGA
jgi:hypothetical protein